MVDACAPHGILPFYGPFGDIKDVGRLRGPVPQRLPARLRRRVEPAPGADRHRQEGLLPDPAEVKFAKKVIEAIPDGTRRRDDRRQDAGRRHLEAVQGDGRPATRELAASITATFIASLREDANERVRRRQRDIDGQVAQLTASIDKPLPGTTESRIEQMRLSRAALVQEGAQLVADGIAEAVSARRVGPPSALSDPVSPRPKLNILAGLVFGLLLGAVLAWWRERRAAPLRSAEEAATLSDAPVLATVPLRRRVAAGDPLLAEAYDVLCANLMFQARDQGHHVITVVSENARAGKSSTVEGLAQAAERAGSSVGVIDADLRLAGLSSRFGVTGGASLAEVIANQAQIDEALVAVTPGISLIAARAPTPDPPRLLNTPRMREIVESLERRFDLVLIDSPPLGGLADGLLLSSLSDGVLMVVRAGTTSRPDLIGGIKRIRQTRTPIVGLVVFAERELDTTYYPPRPAPQPLAGAPAGSR
jgi:capsular exopolysaccharide synthesis family protein